VPSSIIDFKKKLISNNDAFRTTTHYVSNGILSLDVHVRTGIGGDVGTNNDANQGE
jgi:hypothetical protein